MPSFDTWIDALKPGDKVFVRGYGWGDDTQVREVSRVTKTLVFLKNGATEDAYSKKTLNERGYRGYHSPFLAEYNADNIADYKAYMNKRRLSALLDLLSREVSKHKMEDKRIAKVLKALEPFDDLGEVVG